MAATMEAVKPVRLFEWRLNPLVMLVADRTREAVLVVEEKAWGELLTAWQPLMQKIHMPQTFWEPQAMERHLEVWSKMTVLHYDNWNLKMSFFLKQHFMNTCERRFQVVCMISDESAIEVYGIPSYCSLFASYCSLFSWFQSQFLSGKRGHGAGPYGQPNSAYGHLSIGTIGKVRGKCHGVIIEVSLKNRNHWSVRLHWFSLKQPIRFF